MSRRCTICDHGERAEIDARIAGGAAIRGLARRFRVSEDAVGRHRKHVVPDFVEVTRAAKRVAALEKVEAETSVRVANFTRAESIVEKIRALEDEARRLQAVAEAQGDTRAALVALRELRETLAAWTKLVPIEVDGASLEASPEWTTLRTAVLAALEPFPEAKAAVAAAMLGRRALASPGATPRALPPAREDAALEVVGAARDEGKSEAL